MAKPKHEGKPAPKHAGARRGTPRSDAPTAGGGGPKPTRNAIVQRGNNGGILKAITEALWRK